MRQSFVDPKLDKIRSSVGLMDYFNVKCVSFFTITCTSVRNCTQPQSGHWKHWNTMIPEETDDLEYSKKKIQETLVPTLDTVRYQYIMDLCIKQSRFCDLFGFIALICSRVCLLSASNTREQLFLYIISRRTVCDSIHIRLLVKKLTKRNFAIELK